MAIHFYKGFNIDKISSYRVSLKEAVERGFDPKKIENVDKDKNGFIDGDEFLSGGINDITLYSIFTELAGEDYIPTFEDETFEDNEQLKALKETKDSNKIEELKPSNETKTKNSKSRSQNPFAMNNSHSSAILMKKDFYDSDYTKKFDYFC